MGFSLFWLLGFALTVPFLRPLLEFLETAKQVGNIVFIIVFLRFGLRVGKSESLAEVSPVPTANLVGLSLVLPAVVVVDNLCVVGDDGSFHSLSLRSVNVLEQPSTHQEVSWLVGVELWCTICGATVFAIFLLVSLFVGLVLVLIFIVLCICFVLTCGLLPLLATARVLTNLGLDPSVHVLVQSGVDGFAFVGTRVLALLLSIFLDVCI